MKWKIRAVDPPKAKKVYVKKLSLFLAILFIIIALLQLVRIDTFLPIITLHIGPVSLWFVAAVLIVEVFALPYLLLLRLSPLMRIISGLCVIAAPLIWTGYTIWIFGSPVSTGQFGAYFGVKPSLGLLLVNGIWLAASYWLLWASNYDQVFRFSRKRPFPRA